MANHRLGLHWLRYHPDNRDFAHIEAMQYPSVKTFEWMHNSRDFCSNLLTVLPRDSYILARNHSRSEEKEDVWRDPVATGRRHADAWQDDIRNGHYHLPTDRTFFLSANEPDATTGDRVAIDRYTETYLVRLQQHGLRGGAFSFSTGHPRTVDGTGNTLADYSVFESSRAAIVRGHHIAVLHIYGSSQMPLVPGHFDRLHACPWQDVTWVVGECGIDEHVTSGAGHYGYKGILSGEEYCRWLDTLIMGVNDSRIHSWQVFTYDFSHPWATFDIAPIRGDLESYPWQHGAPVSQPTPPPPPSNTVHIPTVTVGPARVLYVTAAAGLNLRKEPTTDAEIVTRLSHGAGVEVSVKQGDWWSVSGGWLHGAWLSETQPEPVSLPVVETPAQLPAQDKWARSLAFVLRWEGGWADHPQDPGGATMKGITLGTYTRWREAQGQPQPTKADLRAISDAEVEAIYRAWYWQASGADQLPWPLCLAHFDTAVNGGVGRAAEMLQRSGGNVWRYLALVMDWYTRLDTFGTFGRAWIRRRTELLLEAAQFYDEWMAGRAA